MNVQTQLDLKDIVTRSRNAEYNPKVMSLSLHKEGI